MIYENRDIRQASLMGYGEDPSQQIMLVCTVLDDVASSHSISIALPASGQYSVRRDDVAAVSIEMGDQVWSTQMTVEENSSAGFFVTLDFAPAREIVDALEVAPKDMRVSIAVGPIDESVTIRNVDLGSHATEWIDGCGR